MTDSFRQAIIDHGLNPPDYIEAGRFMRFPGDGKRHSNKAGWCKLFDDQQYGIYGDHSTGLSESWRADCHKIYTPQEKKAFAVERAKAEREAEQAKKELQAEAAISAKEKWDKCLPEMGMHKYLMAKNVQSYKLRNDGFKIVIPMYDQDRNICSVQTIDPNGEKRFFTGGRTDGVYFPIGKPNGVMCIAEGYSTAATIHEATGHAVAVAFTCENLQPVAEMMSRKFSNTKFIICADDDHEKAINVGMENAARAAASCDGVVAVPDFKDNKKGNTDFNDMARLFGMNAVKSVINGKNVADVASQYRELKRFSDELLPVQPVPYDALPEAMGEWVKDVSNMMGCSDDFLIAGALTGLSGLLGHKIVINAGQNRDWTIVPNLWGGIVGRPSTKKTPSADKALSYITNKDKKLRDESAEDMKLYRAEYKIQKIQFKKDSENKNGELSKLIQAGDKELAKQFVKDNDPDNIPKPPRRRLIVHDSTVEKLCMLLEDNTNGLIVVRDELSGLLSYLDKEDNSIAKNFFLTAYNGNTPYSQDRVTRDDVYLECCIISLFGGIQPSKLKPYLRQAVSGVNDDGLMQRLQLLVYPDPTISVGEDVAPDEKAKKEFDAIFKYFNDIIGHEDSIVLKFDKEAQEVFDTWHKQNMDKVRDEQSPSVEAHLSKYPSMVASLALIIHLADERKATPVSRQAILKACVLTEYLESHARRIYGIVESPDYSARSLADNLHNLPNPFKASDFRSKHWSGLCKKEEREFALIKLIEHGYLYEMKSQVQNNNQTVSSYFKNPLVMEG